MLMCFLEYYRVSRHCLSVQEYELSLRLVQNAGFLWDKGPLMKNCHWMQLGNLSGDFPHAQDLQEASDLFVLSQIEEIHILGSHQAQVTSVKKHFHENNLTIMIN